MKKILYLGTDPSHFITDKPVVHYPVIVLKPMADSEICDVVNRLEEYTHSIFTSKNAVELFFSKVSSGIRMPCCISVGPVTTRVLEGHGVKEIIQADSHMQEGVIQVLKERVPRQSRILYPKSSKARSLLSKYLQENYPHVTIVELYEPVFQQPGSVPPLEEIEQIVFTSPSTVEAFHRIVPHLPAWIIPVFQGGITERCFNIVYNI